MSADLPCTLTLHVPFPSPHLTLVAQRALAVDAELSQLVRRSLTLVRAEDSAEENVLQVCYAATTNRMLRVAVNGFIESIGVIVDVMRDVDVDVVYNPVAGSLEGVQGLETINADNDGLGCTRRDGAKRG